MNEPMKILLSAILIGLLHCCKNSEAYLLCRTITSPNCNNTRTEVYRSSSVVWNKASRHVSPALVISEAVVIFIILLTSLVSNGALIATLVFEARFRTPTNFLIIGQCIGDLFLTLTVILPAFIASVQGSWKLSAIWCMLQVFFNRFFLMVTFMNLAFLAIDRYIVIVKTDNRNRFSTKQIFMAFAMIWMSSFLLSFPFASLLYPAKVWYEATNTFCLYKYTQPISTGLITLLLVRVLVSIIIPILITIFCFCRIFGVVRTNRRKVGPSTVSNVRKIAIAVHAKSAYTSGAVLISFALSIMPFLFVFVLVIIKKEVSYATLATTKSLYYANTSVKALIYISRNVLWSRKLLRLFTRKHRSKRVIMNSPDRRRSSKYEIKDMRMKTRRLELTCSMPRVNSRKQLTSIDFHELFSVNGARQAWNGNEDRGISFTAACSQVDKQL
eukprot:gene16049-17671_t